MMVEMNTSFILECNLSIFLFRKSLDSWVLIVQKMFNFILTLLTSTISWFLGGRTRMALTEAPSIYKS